jgi:hypothetical protein
LFLPKKKKKRKKKNKMDNHNNLPVQDDMNNEDIPYIVEEHIPPIHPRPQRPRMPGRLLYIYSNKVFIYS